MTDTNLGVVEARFADIIWQHEPIHSRELAQVCAQELNWKRPPHIMSSGNSVKREFSRMTRVSFPQKSADRISMAYRGNILWRGPLMARCRHLSLRLRHGKNYLRQRFRN